MPAFNAACNARAAVAFAQHLANTSDRHKLLYSALRQPCALAAQRAIRARAKVAEAYQRDKTLTPALRPHGAMVYDERIGNCPTPARVSPLTWAGRVVVPCRCAT